MRPTYLELLQALRDAPPKQSITDQRYWDWSRTRDELLERAEEVVTS